MTRHPTTQQTVRDQILIELDEIRSEILDLATDHAVFWKVQKEVIQRNQRLLLTKSAFFDMFNESYAHATGARIRRLADRDSKSVSLQSLMNKLKSSTKLFAGNFTVDDLKRDSEQLVDRCKRVTDYVNKYVAHHDRYQSATCAPTSAEFDDAINAIVQIFKKYYCLLTEADIDVVAETLEDPLVIFRFPWIESARDVEYFP